MSVELLKNKIKDIFKDKIDKIDDKFRHKNNISIILHDNIYKLEEITIASNYFGFDFISGSLISIIKIYYTDVDIKVKLKFLDDLFNNAYNIYLLKLYKFLKSHYYKGLIVKPSDLFDENSPYYIDIELKSNGTLKTKLRFQSEVNFVST